ncbi:neuroendocrine convertase 1-like [Engraulis encrasicolus]|uniref:neuroendocrine convertase 1-like n=1 Tax=Engraulis encrasicolus TaxID=184585 RepID=UPI002FD020DF
MLWMLQWREAATEGQRGTDSSVFYAVEMEGGVAAAQSLAKQYGLQFISRVGGLEHHFTLRDDLPRDSRAALESSLALTPGYNRGQYSQAHLDLNVMPVWQNSITGQGVVVTIIDDGVDHTNADLHRNFEPNASVDLRDEHGLSHDPMPLRDAESGHGTRCAGEVAMEANNSYCGVGIAYNARVGGIRLLDGPVTDAMEASALSFNSSFIDVYVCSWGPRDNGAEIGGPAQLAEKALLLGTQKGRGGKGNIFVWASGNGGTEGDHCGADGYINSISTIAIGGITHTGKPAFFSEPCPATMAVTLTGGNRYSVPMVTVSNLDDGCISEFAGTSSAAPLAAGIIALVLEAKPEMTWRDVQHLIARTAKVPDPEEPGWILNGAGFHVHDRYGFGLLDAGLMVQQALQFQLVSPQRRCSHKVALDPVRRLPEGREVSLDIQSDACSGGANQINTLEHVQWQSQASSSPPPPPHSTPSGSPTLPPPLHSPPPHSTPSGGVPGLPLNHTCHPRHPRLAGPQPGSPKRHPSSWRQRGPGRPSATGSCGGDGGGGGELAQRDLLSPTR